MTLRNLYSRLVDAPTERLERLADRLDCSNAPVILPRHYVRLLVLCWIGDILCLRRQNAYLDN